MKQFSTKEMIVLLNKYQEQSNLSKINVPNNSDAVNEFMRCYQMRAICREDFNDHVFYKQDDDYSVNFSLDNGSLSQPNIGSFLKSLYYQID